MVDYVVSNRLGGKDQASVHESGTLRQEEPAVAQLASGGVVVVYIDDRAVMLQRYDADGVKIGEASAITPGGSMTSNHHPSIAALADGGFAVSWTKSSEIVVQVFNADGEATTDIFGVGGATNYQQQSSIAGLANGDFVVAWTFNGSPSTIKARIFHPDGEAASTQLNVYGAQYSNSYFPKVAALDEEGFVVSWNGDFDNSGSATIRARSYDSEGNRVGTIVRIGNEPEHADNFYQSIAGLDSGKYVLTWVVRDFGGIDRVMAQFCDSTGAKLGDAFQVNSDTSYAAGQPSVTALEDGGFLVTWWLRVPSPGGNVSYFRFGDVRAQAFNADGTKAGEEFLVNQVTDVGQDMPAVAAFGTGDLAVVWRSFTESAGSTIESRFFYSVRSGDSAANIMEGTPSVDILRGLSGHDSLDGGAGADILDGGAGNDIFYVDETADEVVERPSEGRDKVYSSVSFSLAGGDVEKLVLTGSAAIDGMGNGLANALVGNSANNVLNGGAGVDTMTGGKGDDTFYVDDGGDQVLESKGEGEDRIFSSVSFSLAGQHIERLTLTGAAAADGTGNSLANVLIGNRGRNHLDGGTGADVMAGGHGHDTYHVDHANDAVSERSGQGLDHVFASVAFSLAGRQVEKLTLTGSDPIEATGNSLANTLTGNGAGNRLDGGSGADLMIGGRGNDTFYVDDEGDRVVELYWQGRDHILSSVSFTLAGQHVEKLSLTGSSAISASGNSLANILVGNSVANALDGGTGNDRLYGRDGDDSLTGGAGADRFYFDTNPGAGNVDSILDFAPDDDALYLDRSIFRGIDAGPLAADAFASGIAAADGNDRIIYDADTGNLRFDSDGDGPIAAVLFARIGAATEIGAGDFFAYGG